MKLRTQLALTLAAGAFVPLAVALAWMGLDVTSAQRRADDDQANVAVAAKNLIAERLVSLKDSIDLARANLLAAPASDYEALLMRTVENISLLSNLHVDTVDVKAHRATPVVFYPPATPKGEAAVSFDHSERWHALAAYAGLKEDVLFSPALAAANDGGQIVTLVTRLDEKRILSGVVTVERLFGDIDRMLRARGFLVRVTDAAGDTLWPVTEPLSPGNAFKAPARAATKAPDTDHPGQFCTHADMTTSVLPAWRITVMRPAAEREALNAELYNRALWLAGLLLLTTLAVAALSGAPLKRALEGLTREFEGLTPIKKTDAALEPDEVRVMRAAFAKARALAQEKTEAMQELVARWEETATERGRALAAESRLFESVFAGITDAVIVFSRDARVLRANRAGEALAADVVAELAQKIDCCEGAVRFKWQAAKRVFEVRVYPIEDVAPTGESARCTVLTDVTQAQKLDDMKDALIGIVAHELKTPVTTLQLEVADAQKKLKAGDTDGTHASLDLMTVDLKRLSRLVSDWLSVAKIEGGNFSVAPDFIQMTPVISRAVRLVRARYDFGIAVNVNEDAEGAWADADALTELLTNLISNACRYAKPATRPVVRIDVTRDDAAPEPVLRITVADNGRGIAPEHLERIFDRFYMVEGKGAKGGTGLGLVICRAIAMAHGGDIRAQSDETGTRFIVTIPQPVCL